MDTMTDTNSPACEYVQDCEDWQTTDEWWGTDPATGELACLSRGSSER